MITEPQPLCVLAVCPLITPAPRGPLLRRCVITAIFAPTAPCASLVSTSEFPASRLYRQPRGQETFPVLHPRPCDHATAPTPESSSEASARLFPEDSALARVEWARRSHTPQLPSRGRASRRCSDSLMLRPGRLLALLAVPSCDGEGFILKAFIRVVTQPRRPIRYVAVRLLPRPVLPRLVWDVYRLHSTRSSGAMGCRRAGSA